MLTEVMNRIPSQRRIDLVGTLSTKVAVDIEEKLGKLQKEPGHILINIDCGGGHFEAGVQLYRALRTGPNVVIGNVRAKAMSAGFMALQGCEKRIAGSESKLYIHDPMGYNVQNPLRYNTSQEEFVKEQIRWFKVCQPILIENRKTMFKILIKQCMLGGVDLGALLDRDRPMTAPEALGFGFIDEIV